MSPRAGLDECGESRLPPGFDPRNVQPVASRCIHYVIPGVSFIQLLKNLKYFTLIFENRRDFSHRWYPAPNKFGSKASVFYTAYLEGLASCYKVQSLHVVKQDERFVDFTTTLRMIPFVCDLTLSRRANGYRHYRESCCLHMQGQTAERRLRTLKSSTELMREMRPCFYVIWMKAYRSVWWASGEENQITRKSR